MRANRMRVSRLQRHLLASGLGVLGALGALAPAALATPTAPAGSGRTGCLPAATASPAARLSAAPGPAGIVQRLHLADDPRATYFIYLPRRLRPGAPIVVSVHGISRNAREHAERFAPFAEATGSVLVAPLFTEQRFAGYQRLQADRDGVPPDRWLLRVVDDVAARSGADSRRLYLFGYSGGGQFVHRFALAHPDRVARYAIGAAGWYTFPDEQRRFPLGLRAPTDGADEHAPGPFALDAFLHLPGVVLVGELDRTADDALRESGRVVRQQGDNRLTRGRNWVAAVREAAHDRGLPAPVRFETLPHAPHSFTRSMVDGGMGARVFAHFFSAAEQADGQDSGPATAEEPSPAETLACIVTS